MTRHCTKCAQDKPLSAFYSRNNRASGVTSKCRECLKPEARERSARPDVKTQRASRPWPQKIVYRLSPDFLNNTFNGQDRRCAICKETLSFESTPAYRPHIDHNHKTGSFRGLLCKHCNCLLGNAKDSLQTLKNAIEYLSCR